MLDVKESLFYKCSLQAQIRVIFYKSHTALCVGLTFDWDRTCDTVFRFICEYVCGGQSSPSTGLRGSNSGGEAWQLWVCVPTQAVETSESADG